MGCAQFELLDEYIQAKRSIAARYAEALAEAPGITLPSEAEWAFSIFWMYTVLVDEVQYGMDSRKLMHQLGKAGVQARPLWQPLHRSPAHVGSQAYLCEVANWLNQQGISLPCSVGLLGELQDKVIKLIRQT